QEIDTRKAAASASARRAGVSFPVRRWPRLLRGASVGEPGRKCDLRGKRQENQKPVWPTAAKPERLRGYLETSASLRAIELRLRDDVPTERAVRRGGERGRAG